MPAQESPPAEGTLLFPDDLVLLAAAEAANAPHIYMAIQPDAGGPVSVIFVVDRSRDGTPSDEPAIRLTPENGKCNMQVLRYFAFPAEAAEWPVFSQNEALVEGIAGQEIANLMAIEVTSEMMRMGLADTPQETKPQNVCARKLWERLLVSKGF